MAVDSQGTAPGQEVFTAVITPVTHHPTLRRLKNDRRCQIPVAQVGRARVRHPRRSDTPAMFEPDLGPMPDDDDDELNDELNDIGLLTREAPAAKTTKAKSAPREKPAPKSSAWELTGNAELDALFQSSTLTARSLNVAASRPSTTGPSQGKPLRSTPVEVPISRAEKILAKLAEQKEEDDKESKKLDRQRKRVEDDARAEAAAASARAAAEAHDARVEAQLAGAIQLGQDVKEKAARVEAALADAGDGSDETPSPRDVARALRDDAFEPDTLSRPGSDPRDSCVTNMPRSVRDAPSDASAIANAAEADAKRRGADAGDAVAHALREAIVGGWLEQRFLIARRDGEAAGAAGGAGEGEAKRKDSSPVMSVVGGVMRSAAAAILGGGSRARESVSPAALVRAPPLCAEDTARWLFQTATAPSSARDASWVTICARNALYASLGFEPNPALAPAPRWLCGTPTLRAPPAVPWRIKASDIIGALGACGVVVDVDALGESLGKESRAGAGAGVGEPSSRTAAKRKRPAAATTGGEGDGLCALSGRGEGDREATVQLYQDKERRRLRPQIFAAIQIAGAAAAAARWTPRRRFASATVTPVKGSAPPASAANAVREEGPHCWVRDDPEGAADLLAVLAGLRIDPRAGALRAAVDHCAENLLAAAALGCDGDEWRAFRSAAASKLAKVGPTHVARLAAIRWIPWSNRKEQEVQDLAALVAIEHIVPLILQRLEADDSGPAPSGTNALAKKKKPRPNPKAKKPAEKSDDVDAWQRRAVQALDPIRVDVESDVDAAWAIHTAMHLADIVLHAGTLGGGAGLRGRSLGANGAPRTPGKEAAESASLDAAAESFMQFLKRTKANIPRSGKTAMNALKNLAVVIFTRQQRAEQLRRTKTEHERANSSSDDDDGEDEDEDE